MTNKNQTLGEFIIENQKSHQYSSGELSSLINSIRLAAKVVNFQVNKAGLVDIIGDSNKINTQGEDQQKLDFYANDIFINALRNRNIVCGIASEVNDYIRHGKKWDVLYNNLLKWVEYRDQSSNIDVNIFSTIQAYNLHDIKNLKKLADDFLQEGSKQVAAGYIIYGTSTMLVYTTGHGVNGFTLNPAIGTFYLSHPKITFPANGSIYSINEGNYVQFPKGVKDYIKYCQSETNKPAYTSRYIGSLVSDFHRNMIKGGIYMYPKGSRNPNGKLRLLYECNPIAFICEQAGGIATNGFSRILDVNPKTLHQRIPFYCGSSDMVKKLKYFRNN